MTRGQKKGRSEPTNGDQDLFEALLEDIIQRECLKALKLAKRRQRSLDRIDKVNAVKDADGSIRNRLVYIIIAILISVLILVVPIFKSSENAKTLSLDLDRVRRLNLEPKKEKIIFRKLSEMNSRFTTLVLLGSDRDRAKKISDSILAATQRKFKYVNAESDPLDYNKLNTYDLIMIDRLEALPGYLVRNLFGILESGKEKGLVLMSVYIGEYIGHHLRGKNDAELAEQILNDKWSEFVARSTLASVISRISVSVLRYEP